jgi:hypothetical protein
MAIMNIEDLKSNREILTKFVNDELYNSEILNSGIIETTDEIRNALRQNGDRIAIRQLKPLYKTISVSDGGVGFNGTPSTPQKFTVNKDIVPIQSYSYEITADLLSSVLTDDKLDYNQLAKELVDTYSHTIETNTYKYLRDMFYQFEIPLRPLILDKNQSFSIDILTELQTQNDGFGRRFKNILVNNIVYSKMLGISNELREMGTFLGIKVILDKGGECTVRTDNTGQKFYRSYLIDDGAFVFGKKDIGDKSLQFDEDKSGGADYTFVKSLYVLQPRGLSFNDMKVTPRLQDIMDENTSTITDTDSVRIMRLETIED